VSKKQNEEDKLNELESRLAQAPSVTSPNKEAAPAVKPGTNGQGPQHQHQPGFVSGPSQPHPQQPPYSQGPPGHSYGQEPYNAQVRDGRDAYGYPQDKRAPDASYMGPSPLVPHGTSSTSFQTTTASNDTLPTYQENAPQVKFDFTHFKSSQVFANAILTSLIN
jgi:hypothetical protein